MKKNLTDFGLLILRLCYGFSVAYAHGFGKISGGIEKWEKLGANMSVVGIDFAPVFWGFMAAFAEFFGCIMVGIGFFTRTGAMLMSITMLVAFNIHISKGDEFSGGSHAFDLMAISVFFVIVGAGKYSLDNKIKISKWLQ